MHVLVCVCVHVCLGAEGYLMSLCKHPLADSRTPCQDRYKCTQVLVNRHNRRTHVNCLNHQQVTKGKERRLSWSLTSVNLWMSIRLLSLQITEVSLDWTFMLTYFFFSCASFLLEYGEYDVLVWVVQIQFISYKIRLSLWVSPKI